MNREPVAIQFTAFVMFRGYLMPEERHWWDVFTCDGFRHCSVCYAMTWPVESMFAQNGAVLVDTRAGGLEVSTYPEPVGMLLYRAAMAGRISHLVKYPVEKYQNLSYAPVDVLTCVGTVKSVLGIYLKRIQTPKQLYKYLLDTGGEEQRWVPY